MTGANGRLGPYVLNSLLKRGYEVTLFSRRQPSGEAQSLPWIQGDCNCLEDCVRAMDGAGFTAVMHVAALPHPTDMPGTEDFEDLQRAPVTMQTNVMGLYNMLSAAYRAQVPIFVQTGSNCVMGHERRTSDTPPAWQYLPVDEFHPGDPQDSYSVSKACGEILLKSFSAYGMHTYALRSGWVLDAEGRERIRTVRAAAPTDDLRKVFNSYIAAEDDGEAHAMVLDAAVAGKLLPFDVFYVHADDTLAPEPTMELLEKFRPDLIPLLRRPLEGYASFFDNSRIRQFTGWRPAISWRRE